MAPACSMVAVCVALAACSGLAVGVSALLVGQARGATIITYNAGAPRPSSARHRTAPSPHRVPHPQSDVPVASPHGVPHAPSGAPVVSPANVPQGPPPGSTAPQGEREDAAVPSAEGDQLVENGLSSPLCKSSTSGALSHAAQSNCQTSGFVGAPAPTNNYAIDVHIDVGAFGLSKGGLLSVIQDVFITPVWNAIVWVVHALVVLLEWSFTLELLNSSTMGGVARSMRQAQASFTEPWLALVLAVASILAFYNGLIRRRVAETLGQALTTFVMMAVGLWVIADPLGTVGAVGQWANQASLGTLGAVAQGTPANAPRTLADSMRALFSGAIEMPWCYLEFGNVRWCSDPALLDPRLRKAAVTIAAVQQLKLGCPPGAGLPLCASQGNASRLAIEHSYELVREADTNGKLFLAFPANEPERNSISETSSLLRVLCQSGDDTKCTGSTAAQAEFRSGAGTFPRMIGVVLIAGGVLGMVLLFGLVAVHLLAAAIASLFMLLLAPFAVLAPALGDGGRAVFAGWVKRLLAAVTSKLLFSFLLGALLTMQRLLMSLELLGWWTQWLLISAFWWAVFFKRHQAMAWLQSRGGEPVARSRPSIARRVGEALEAPRALLHPVRKTRDKLRRPAPDVKPRSKSRLKPHTKIPPAPEPEKQSPAGGGTDAEGPTGGKGGGDGGSGKGGGGNKSGGDGGTARERKRAGGGERVGRKRGRYRNSGLAGEQAAVQAAFAGGGAGQAGQGGQLERVRREREKALANGDTRRAAKLGAREQRIEGTHARRETLELAMVAPELEVGELAAIAVAGRHAGRQGAQDGRVGGVHPAGGHSQPVGPAGEAARRGPQAPRSSRQDPSTAGIRQAGEQGDASERARQSSSVMDDAREVAVRRKRQLGSRPRQ